MIKSIVGWISFLLFMIIVVWEMLIQPTEELDGDISHEGIQSLESARRFAKGYKPTEE